MKEGHVRADRGTPGREQGGPLAVEAGLGRVIDLQSDDERASLTSNVRHARHRASCGRCAWLVPLTHGRRPESNCRFREYLRFSRAEQYPGDRLVYSPHSKSIKEGHSAQAGQPWQGA